MRFLVMGVIVSILLSGCGAKKYQLFENDNPELVSQSQDINISYEGKIASDDILSIDIYNMNQKSNVLRDGSILGQITAVEPNNRYIVSETGTIYLPLLNEITVEGLTAPQLSQTLTNAYKKYLRDPYVKVMIKNHKVYVLGEVQKQGIVPIDGNSISVIEAISKSGGLTDHSMTDRVRVVSQENGKYKLRTINLNQLTAFNAQNLMLNHNSIVYVEPEGSKAFRVAVQDYLPIIQAISSISSTFLTIDYIGNK